MATTWAQEWLFAYSPESNDSAKNVHSLLVVSDIVVKGFETLIKTNYHFCQQMRRKCCKKLKDISEKNEIIWIIDIFLSERDCKLR